MHHVTFSDPKRHPDRWVGGDLLQNSAYSPVNFISVCYTPEWWSTWQLLTFPVLQTPPYILHSFILFTPHMRCSRKEKWRETNWDGYPMLLVTHLCITVDPCLRLCGHHISWRRFDDSKCTVCLRNIFCNIYPGKVSRHLFQFFVSFRLIKVSIMYKNARGDNGIQPRTVETPSSINRGQINSLKRRQEDLRIHLQ